MAFYLLGALVSGITSVWLFRGEGNIPFPLREIGQWWFLAYSGIGTVCFLKTLLDKQVSERLFLSIQIGSYVSIFWGMAVSFWPR